MIIPVKRFLVLLIQLIAAQLIPVEATLFARKMIPTVVAMRPVKR